MFDCMLNPLLSSSLWNSGRRVPDTMQTKRTNQRNRLGQSFRIIATWLPLVAIVGLVAGCAATASKDASGAEKVLTELRRSYQTTPDRHMNGTLIASGMPVTVWFDAIVKSHDSLKIIMNGPFGIPVGALGATPGSFLFLNVPESMALEGTPNRETFQKMLGIGLSYQEIVALLRGEIPNLPASGNYTADMSNDLLRYSVTAADHVEQFTVDPATLDIVDYVRRRRAADTIVDEITISYKNFIERNGVRFARRAQVRVAAGEQTMQVNFDDVRNQVPEDADCIVEVPAGTSRQKL